jgi:hypothetical protein
MLVTSQELIKLYQAYSMRGLYTVPFDCVVPSIHRHIQYANNVLLVESDATTADEVLITYVVHDEAKRCFYWSEEITLNFLKAVNLREFSIDSFERLYKTHFRGNKIFDKIDLETVNAIYSLSDPAYNDWSGEFLIHALAKKYVLMWDYAD